jgi:hypothetical protein
MRPRIAFPEISSPGSTGNDVHAHGENAVLPFFSRTGQKKGHLNLHNSGLYFAPFFRRCLEDGAGAKRTLWEDPTPGKKVRYIRVFSADPGADQGM